MQYFIASLKHTNKYHEHISFWGPDRRGYTPVFGSSIGRYDAAEAARLNDGQSFIAIPCEAVEKLLTPEPYWKPGARFYDQRGRVLENTTDNWKALILSRMPPVHADLAKPKPEVFKGKRRRIPASILPQEDKQEADTLVSQEVPAP